MTEPVRKTIQCTVSQGDTVVGKATVEITKPFMRRVKGRMKRVDGLVLLRGRAAAIPDPLVYSFVFDRTHATGYRYPISLRFQSGTTLLGVVLGFEPRKKKTKTYEAELLIYDYHLPPRS